LHIELLNYINRIYIKNILGLCEPCNQLGFLRTVDDRGVPVCLRCLDNCDECITVNTCEKCATNYLLQNGVCSECSLPGQFKVLHNNTCVTCDPLCKVCASETECGECLPNLFDQDGVCTLCMDAGLFRIESEMRCVRCQEHCDVCATESTCDICAPNYFLNPNKTCVECRGNGEHRNETTGTCHSCGESCINCLSEFKCSSCLPNFNLYEYEHRVLCINCSKIGKRGSIDLEKNTCVQCPLSSYYLEKTTSGGSAFCKRCIDNCHICHNDKKCIGCAEGYFRSGNKCTLCNSHGTFKTADPAGYPVCKSCSEHCSICITEYMCGTCIEGFHLNAASQCVRCDEPGNIIAKNFLGNTECIICKPGCEKCHDQYRCKLCVHDLYLKGNECIPCSNPGEFRDKRDDLVSSLTVNVCRDCMSHCVRCQEENVCQACSEDFVLTKGRCQQCNNPGEIKVTTEAGEESCVICQRDCQRCATQSICRSCMDGYYISDGQCTLCNEPGLRKSKDPFGIDICTKCQINCHKCDAMNRCLNCQAGYYLLKGVCVQCNDLGQVRSVTHDGITICKVCSERCAVCLTEDSCGRCFDSFFLKEGKCVACDKPWEIINESSQTCNDCTDNCQKCGSNQHCQVCHVGYYINSGRCYPCRPGDNLLFSTCVNCRVRGCSVCRNAQSCAQCLPDYHLLGEGEACVPCNEEGQFAYIDPLKRHTSRCVACADFCHTCLTESICKTCKEGFYKLKGRCVVCDGIFERKTGAPDGTGVCVWDESKIKEDLSSAVHPAIHSHAAYITSRSRSNNKNEVRSSSNIVSSRRSSLEQWASIPEVASNHIESQGGYINNEAKNYDSWKESNLIDMDSFFSGYKVNFIHKKGVLVNAQTNQEGDL
jgi:proprotein convertase subtilisin/kexin type 5